jgi:hypothetical protein
MHWRKLLGVVAIVGALGACEEGPASSVTFTTTPDIWIHVQGGASTMPLIVEARGGPFDRTNAALRSAIRG